MRGALSLVVAGMVVSFWVHAQGGAGETRFEIYPWSEQSATARVDKKLLRKFPVTSVTWAQTGTRQFVLTGNFIEVFKLSPAEIQQVTSALTNALHEYRTIESGHCEPAPEPQGAGRLARGPREEDQRFSFRVKPFPEQAAAIRAKLEESVLATLGEERAKILWENEHLMDGAMRQCRKEQDPWVGMTTRSYTFVLPAKDRGRVDLHTTDEEQGPGLSRGRGTARDTFVEPLDRYAPESMRPILAEWRKDARPAGAGAPKENTPLDIRPGSGNGPKWDERAAYADVPKAVLNTLKLPGLNVNEELAPEMKGLLGFGEAEEKAVMALYTEMKTKFEKLERANCHRVEPTKNSFVIKAFRKEGAALKREWTERLAKQVGPARARLLDDSIQKGRTAFFERMGAGGVVDNGPSWLARGMDETRLDFTVGEREGRPTLHFEYRTGPGGAARSGSGSAPGGQIPKRWQHLVTPEMLKLPMTV